MDRQTVYLVIRSSDIDGYDVMAVWANEDAARRDAESRITRSGSVATFRVEPWIVLDDDR